MLSGVCFVLHGDWPTALGYWLDLFYFFIFKAVKCIQSQTSCLSETTFGLRYLCQIAVQIFCICLGGGGVVCFSFVAIL